MDRVPESRSIALLIVACSWSLALLAYLFGASTVWILNLFVLGVLVCLGASSDTKASGQDTGVQSSAAIRYAITTWLGLSPVPQPLL